MAKKKARQETVTDAQEVTSKKARRRKARSAASVVVTTTETQSTADEPMSQCALLCQQNRWREAALLLRKTCAKARKDGKEDIAGALEMALPKIDYSLRRQMAAAFIVASKELLKKEYLLDVGE